MAQYCLQLISNVSLCILGPRSSSILDHFRISHFLFDSFIAYRSSTAYLQGYVPVPILVHAATTGQFLLNHAIESGPSIITSSPDEDKASCLANHYAVCPKHPVENYNEINDDVKIVGICFFAIQALASIAAIGKKLKKLRYSFQLFDSFYFFLRLDIL